MAPIHLACSAGDLDGVQAELQRAPELIHARFANGRTPLHSAAEGNKVDVCRFLLACDAPNACDLEARDTQGMTALHVACQGGHLDVVRCLVESERADINAVDENNRTPALTAAWANDPEVLAYLVGKGCDTALRDQRQRTPLAIAAFRGSLEAVRCLHLAGAGADSSSEDGRTPLHLAAAYNHPQVVAYLISEADVAVNATDQRGQTPLHLAAYRNHAHVVACLMSAAGVDPGITDQAGDSALDLAERKNLKGIVHLLNGGELPAPPAPPAQPAEAPALPHADEQAPAEAASSAPGAAHSGSTPLPEPTSATDSPPGPELATACDEGHGLPATATVADVCRRLTQLATAARFKDEAALELAKALLVKHEVSAERLSANNIKDTDKDVLQAVEFSHRLRQLLLGPTTAERLPLQLRSSTVNESLWRVGPITFDSTKELGRGSSSTVHAGTWEGGDFRARGVAVKEVMTVTAHGKPTGILLERELEALGELNHENVVALYDTQILSCGRADDRRRIQYLALELADCTLLQALTGGLTEFPSLEARVGELCTGLARGVGALHGSAAVPFEHGLMHRDIKPENILLVSTESGRWVPKLCDMGFALRIKTAGGGASTMSAHRAHAHRAGTPQYMCPHACKITAPPGADDTDTRRFHSKSDIFSLACVFYEVLTAGGSSLAGRHPFQDDDHTRRDSIVYNIGKGRHRLRVADVVRDAGNENQACLATSMVALVESMLSPDLDPRPDITMVQRALTEHFVLADDARYQTMNKVVNMHTAAAVRGLVAGFSPLVVAKLREHLGMPSGTCPGDELHARYQKEWRKDRPNAIASGMCLPKKARAGDLASDLRNKRIGALQDTKRGALGSFGKDVARIDEYLHDKDGRGGHCICLQIAGFLRGHHRSMPCWTNSDAQQWLSSDWELMKAFGSTLGPRATECGSVEDADLSMLLSILAQCKLLREFALTGLALSEDDVGTFFSKWVPKIQAIRNDKIAHNPGLALDADAFRKAMRAVLEFLSHDLFTKLCAPLRDQVVCDLHAMTHSAFQSL